MSVCISLLLFGGRSCLESFSVEENGLFIFQEDLQVALSQGGRLLECINEPLQTDPEYSMTYDELENLDTVQR